MREFEPREKSFEEQLQSFLIENNAIERIYDGDSLDQAGYAWNYLSSQDILSESAIKETHRIITLHQPIPFDQKGTWRNENVWVGKYFAPDWYFIPKLMDEWIRKSNRYQSADLSLEERDYLLQELHVEYEKIHPFIDGNGRTGRMFWNFLRLKCGLPLKIIREAEKHEYYRLFSPKSC